MLSFAVVAMASCTHTPITENKASSVSLAALIENSRAYNGTQVRTEGYASIDFEGKAIYLSREDAEKFVFPNGVRLALNTFELDSSTRLLHQERIIVEGVFRSSTSGELWGGVISKISTIKQADSE